MKKKPLLRHLHLFTSLLEARKRLIVRADPRLQQLRRGFQQLAPAAALLLREPFQVDGMNPTAQPVAKQREVRFLHLLRD